MSTTISQLDKQSKSFPWSAPIDVPGAVPLGVSRTKSHSNNAFEKLLTFLERGADLLTSTLVIFVGYLSAESFLGEQVQSPARVLAVSIGIGLLLVLILDREGAYRAGNGLLRVQETEQVLRACFQCYVLVLCVILLIGPLVSVEWLTASGLLVLLALLAQKQLFYSSVRILHARGMGVRRVIIYGAGYTGRRVFSALARSPKVGLDPVAVVDDDPNRVGKRIFESSYKRERFVPVIAGPVSKELLQKWEAEMVVVAIPSLGREKFTRVRSETASAGVQFKFVPNSYLSSDAWVEHSDIDGLLLASLGRPAERTLYSAMKRVFDLVFSSFLLIILSPLMALLSILIRLNSSGRAIFVQKRVGENGKIFDLYKFRTMYTDAPKYSYSPKTPSDDRITSIGRFLRRTSLDELPQLLNVLKGNMSLVGPRPEMPFIVEQYLPMHRQRLTVKPGLTGLWQISADRAFLIHENIEYDLYYIRNRNFFMDLAVLLHTFFFAMRGI